MDFCEYKLEAQASGYRHFNKTQAEPVARWENELNAVKIRSEAMIMNITKQQLEAAEKGEPVEIEEDERKYVLISREKYDQLSRLSSEELDPEKVYGAVLEAWDSVGSPNDATDYL